MPINLKDVEKLIENNVKIIEGSISQYLKANPEEQIKGNFFVRESDDGKFAATFVKSNGKLENISKFSSAKEVIDYKNTKFVEGSISQYLKANPEEQVKGNFFVRESDDGKFAATFVKSNGKLENISEFSSMQEVIEWKNEKIKEGLVSEFNVKLEKESNLETKPDNYLSAKHKTKNTLGTWMNWMAPKEAKGEEPTQDWWDQPTRPRSSAEVPKEDNGLSNQTPGMRR